MVNFAMIARWVSMLLGASYTMAGAITMTSTLSVTGNFAVNTNKFTVAAASGNTVVAGTLNVTGASTLTGAVAAQSTLVVTGTSTFTGGISATSAPTGVTNWPITVATSGTDTTPASGTQFVTSIFVPVNMTITNINYLIGSVGGTDKVYAVLYDSSGAVVANTDITVSGTNVTVGTAANIQTIPLTAPVAVVGPRRFFVGVSINGGTSRIRTVPAHTQGGILAGSVSQVHGTVAAITPPATFTADKAPVVFVN